MLKIVFVGAGGWASHVHGPALAHYAKQHPGEVELAAVCVRTSLARAREFCENFGFQRTYTNLDEMLEKEKPDACWVVTQISSTRAVVGRVLEAGVPCLLEKPPGASLSEAEELAEIARRTGVANMVAFNRRWAPCTRQAVEWLERVEAVEHFYARMLRPNRMDPTFAFGTGIHLLDCVRCLADEAAGGVLSARTRREESAAGRGSGDVVYNFHVDLKCRSGASGRCDILPACGLTDETYTMFGPKAAITFRLPWSAGKRETPGSTELWVEGRLADSREYPEKPEFLSGGFYGECSKFLAALREGRQPSPPVEECVLSVALASAVQTGQDLHL